MLSAVITRPYSLFITTVLAVLLCASLAMAIVGWTPGVAGLPADVAAIQE